MKYLLLIILCLSASCVFALPPRFIADMTSSEAALVSGISDDFSSDTLSNYTVLAGGVTISGGVAHGTAWTTSRAYHNTTTGSVDSYAQADCYIVSGEGNGCILIVGHTPGEVDDGVRVSYTGNGMDLQSGGGSYITDSAFSSSTGIHTVRLEVRSRVVTAKVDGVTRITNTPPGYIYGQYVGLGLKRDIVGTDNTIDNFSGGAL